MNHFIFTYGTLRKGDYNHYLLGLSKYIGTAKVHGTLATESGSFPQFKSSNYAATEQYFKDEGEARGYETGLVTGEVYECGPEITQSLDRLEIPYGYRRIWVDTAQWFDRDPQAESTPNLVELYEYSGDMKDFTQIPSGDWMEWKHGRAISVQG